MKLILLLLGLVFAFNFSFASGIFNIQGKVVSLNENHFEIDDGRKIYFILKSKITGAEQMKLADLKLDQEVSFVVPFDSISGVKRKKR